MIELWAKQSLSESFLGQELMNTQTSLTQEPCLCIHNLNTPSFGGWTDGTEWRRLMQMSNFVFLSISRETNDHHVLAETNFFPLMLFWEINTVYCNFLLVTFTMFLMLNCWIGNKFRNFHVTWTVTKIVTGTLTSNKSWTHYLCSSCVLFSWPHYITRVRDS